MGKINVLEKAVAELIAAGEVVERPASVVKELAENSVDAGAGAVTVEMRNGGVTFLRVTDDGCGIAREDVRKAFLRHATSKISGREDLDDIATLGFRGEALASVAAVAKVELVTRTQEELAGTRYGIEGGEEQFCEDTGCAPGTTLMVRDLFYNTPARMKFLKKDVTEGNAIAGVLDKAALSHPEVSFRLIRDGKETLHTPGDGQLRSAIHAVYGKEFASGLIPVNYVLGGVGVSGFVSRPANARPNRSMQNFFINGRYVKSRTAMVALEEAFRGSLMAGKVPACVLHLAVPFEAVDVNVHPAKIEVRFVNEKPVFDAVYHGVRAALGNGDEPQELKLTPPAVKQAAPVSVSAAPAVPASAFRQETLFQGEKAAAVPRYTVADAGAKNFTAVYARPPQSSAPHPESTATVKQDGDWRNTLDVGDAPASKQEEAPAPAAEESAAAKAETGVPEEDRELPPARLIGEAFATYILLERGDDLIFIDKHAAHERILYEKLKKQSGGAFSQMLLEPVTVTLEKEEYSALLEAKDICARAGFELDDFGSGTVLVRSAPMVLGGGGVADAVLEIAGYLRTNRNDVTTEKLDWLYHNVACRAAVKAGDSATEQELSALAREVEREDVRYCPHGRPVLFVLKRHELERRFGRLG